MRSMFCGALALSFLCAAGAASAAPCTTQGEASAPPVNFPTPNRQLDVTLGQLMVSTLVPDVADKARRVVGCTRGEFQALGTTYVLTGENGDGVPREAVRADRGLGPSVYLAPLPVPQTANGAAQVRPHALVVVEVNGQRAAKRLYANLPADDVLLRDIPIALGAAPALVALNPTTKQVFVYVGATAPGVSGGPRSLTAPDGQVFVDAGNGAVRHVPTGVVCPAQLNGRPRSRMTIYDPAEGGRDVDCGYGAGGEASWHSFYLTKAAPVSEQDYFDQAAAGARVQATVVNDVASPVPTGAPPNPSRASFWNDRGGLVQGVMVSKIGDWHVKVRTTYSPGAEAETAAIVSALFTEAYAKVPR